MADFLAMALPRLPKHLEIEQALNRPLSGFIAEQRAAGISWRDIANEITRQTKIQVNRETLRLWFADRIEVKTEVTVR
jgi:hypothetical protein